MTGISDRIKNIVDATKGLSNSLIESSCNLGNGSIRRWNESSPSYDKVLRVANFLNVDPLWLMTGEMYCSDNALSTEEQELLTLYNELNEVNKNKIIGMVELKYHEQKEEQDKKLKTEVNIIPLPYKNDTTEPSLEEEDEENVVNIPLLGNTAAGNFIEAIEGIYFDEQIPARNRKADFALKVIGDSMEPLILDDSIIEIQATQSVENGEIAVVQNYDEITCKKVYYREDYVELISINKNYDPMIISTEEIQLNDNAFRVVGRVLF